MLFLLAFHLHKTMPGKLVALTLQPTLSLQGQLSSLHHAEEVGASMSRATVSPAKRRSTLKILL